MKPTFVKIMSSRGYGSRPFRVIGSDSVHFQLKGEDGKTFQMYQLHCFIDSECRSKSAEKKKINVQKILSKKPR